MTHPPMTREPAGRVRPASAPGRPPARHTVIAVFDDYVAAVEASAALRAADPRLEPSIAGPAEDSPFEQVRALGGFAAATLAVHAGDDRAVADALAASNGVRLVYRAGAWTNELVLPRAA